MNKKLLLILLLALVLRLISLNQSLWLDEGIQWWASTTFPVKQLVTEYIKGDFNPPLFHIILHYWIKLFGASAISLRLPSVIFGIATVYFTYKIAIILKVNPVFASLLMATAPLHIYYSQEARMYSLAAFTTTAAFYFLLKRQLVPYVIFATLALYSHYLIWFLIPVLLVLRLIPTLLALLFLTPWLPIFWQQLHQGTSTAVSNPIWGQVVGGITLKNFLLVPIKFLIGRLPVDATLFYAFILFIPLALTAYLIFKAKHKLLYSWLFLPIIFAALISVKIPIFSYFRFLFVLPAFYLLITLGISRLPKKFHPYLITFFMLMNLVSTGLYLFSPQFHRENWRDAAAYIHQQDPSSPVVIYSAVRSPFEYYDRHQSLELSEQNLDELISKPSVWYIPYAQPIFDPENKVTQTLHQLGFEEVSKTHFRGGVTVTRYENPKYKYLSKL